MSFICLCYGYGYLSAMSFTNKVNNGNNSTFLAPSLFLVMQKANTHTRIYHWLSVLLWVFVANITVRFVASANCHTNCPLWARILCFFIDSIISLCEHAIHRVNTTDMPNTKHTRKHTSIKCFVLSCTLSLYLSFYLHFFVKAPTNKSKYVLNRNLFWIEIRFTNKHFFARHDERRKWIRLKLNRCSKQREKNNKLRLINNTSFEFSVAKWTGAFIRWFGSYSLFLYKSTFDTCIGFRFLNKFRTPFFRQFDTIFFTFLVVWTASEPFKRHTYIESIECYIYWIRMTHRFHSLSSSSLLLVRSLSPAQTKTYFIFMFENETMKTKGNKNKTTEYFSAHLLSFLLLNG